MCHRLRKLQLKNDRLINLRGEFTTKQNKSKANRLYELNWGLVVAPPDLF